MTKKDIEYLKEKYLGEDLGGHYADCWRDHIGCCIAKLIEEVEILNKSVNKLASYDYRSYAPLLWKSVKESKA